VLNGVNDDVRWKQRFENFERAFSQFKQAIDKQDEESVSLIKDGTIHRFKVTHELAWKVLKDFLEYEGHQNINGSRSAIRVAFNIDLLADGQVWMNMIDSRNRTVHTYHEKILEQEFHLVVSDYYPAFVQFQQRMHDFL
jgi:nucleotidyltransferase substrate binding protein (TIGR01987 family)